MGEPVSMQETQNRETEKVMEILEVQNVKYSLNLQIRKADGFLVRLVMFDRISNGST